MKRKPRDKKLLNTQELARALDVSVNTFKQFLARHPDFPVEVKGHKGCAWGFDEAKAKAYWAKHYVAGANAKENVEQMSPSQAKAFWDAERIKDQVALSRGELASVSRQKAVTVAVCGGHRKQLQRTILQYSKDHNLTRAQRIDLEKRIADDMNAFASSLENATAQKRLLKAAS